jgi:hypothetical protein
MTSGNDERDPLDSWLSQQVHPLPPPPGTFELITRRARRRKLRRLAVTVASVAAVAAAVAVAVPNVIALHLTPSPVPASVAAGQGSASTSGTQQRSSEASQSTSPPSQTSSASQPSPTGQASPPAAVTPPAGPVPPNFQPASVTFIGTHRGWVLGQAGTPGSCQNPNPYICTSVVWTDDGGKTWHGAPAPNAGAPTGNTGVSGIRFLNETHGWAFGPELWATDDAGRTWAKVGTNGSRVFGLETAGNRAFAIWATCTGTAEPGSPGTALNAAAGCTSFTLMTTVAGSGQWSAVGPATTGLTPGANPTSPALALTSTTGYLLASDGTLYSGPLNGAWQPVGKPICGQLTSQPPPYRLLALVNSGTPVVACSLSAGVQVYTSANGGVDWAAQPASAWLLPRPSAGVVSLAAAPDGTLVLAADGPGVYPDKYGRVGLWVLPAGDKQWRAMGNNLKNPPAGGFSYVGMTTSIQGVALPADTTRHEIWMTFARGVYWASAPIKPGN